MPKRVRHQALRAQLVRLLDWQDAHVGFDEATRGLAPSLRGARPRGLATSPWQLVEHIRLAQRDILEFCGPSYQGSRRWPEDYWPDSPAPPSARAWTASLRAVGRDLEALRRLARNRRVDPFAKVPAGSGQTVLRELLLVADHTAYHVGQLVLVRRMLGAWPPGRRRT